MEYYGGPEEYPDDDFLFIDDGERLFDVSDEVFTESGLLIPKMKGELLDPNFRLSPEERARLKDTMDFYFMDTTQNKVPTGRSNLEPASDEGLPSGFTANSLDERLRALKAVRESSPQRNEGGDHR